MLLAGDVGGTKTLLGLFQRAPQRPVPVEFRAYPTREFCSFTEILEAFARDVRTATAIDRAAVGVAGPVVNQRATLTNVPFDISADEITTTCRVGGARLLNDLEAMANSVDVLTPDELIELQPGVARPDGNAVIIAAGTGLGSAYLHRINGRLRPVPSEGGHADFAARTDREIELVRMLREMYGRAEVEGVLCGPGILNLYRFTHRGQACAALDGAEPGVEPAAISQAALQGTCPACVEALDLFVSAYGSETGNLALRGVATGGVYVGGGIAPKILPLLQRGDFMQAFRSKPPMDDLLARIPVKVILNQEAGLLGAAVYANEM
jgi:glucokinase